MIKFSATLAAMLIIAACGKKGQTADGGGQMSGMHGMMMRSDSMMPMMRAHLDSMAVMQPQFVVGKMPTHEQRASRMLDAMGADMRAMNMRPDTSWTALTDSIKRDLADLPGLSGRTLDQRLDVHIARMKRLMTMHEAMMRADDQSDRLEAPSISTTN